MRYTWLLFDADGTLFDYDQAEINALQGAIAEAGLTWDTRYLELYRPINQQLWLDLERGAILPDVLRVRRFELLFQAIPLNVNALAFSDSYLHHLAQASVLMRGAQEVVEALYKSYRLLIITNGLTSVQRPRFNASPIAHCFSDIVISDEIGVAKPAAGFFDVAFARMQHPRKDEVLVIGDSLTSDMQGGIAYGLDTCWFNPGHAPHPTHLDIRYEISALDELIALLTA
jgi:YjjG family noncanonical pyrimidine nucleotidase